MKVVIYGKPNCSWCVRAKDLAATNPEIEVEYIDIVEAGLGKDELTNIVGKLVTTVPQIIVDGIAVGGYEAFAPIVKALGEQE